MDTGFSLGPVEIAIVGLLGLVVLGLPLAVLAYFLTRKSGGDQ
jgi:hypothetical protein